jgi:hypothetical protein
LDAMTDLALDDGLAQGTLCGVVGGFDLADRHNCETRCDRTGLS